MCCSQLSTSAAGPESCWICLEEGSPSAPLERPCACPRSVHIQCLARWQLQQAGRREESNCRFCNATLPDWKCALTSKSRETQVDPIMVVTLGSTAHRIRVKPGPEGMQEFQAKVRELFAIPRGVEFECTFRCKAPAQGDTIQLEGMASYEAATFCASVLAAQRAATAAAAAAATAASAASSPCPSPRGMHSAPMPMPAMMAAPVAAGGVGGPAAQAVPASFGWVPV